jgi:uncharacterized protein (DUF2141 family)
MGQDVTLTVRTEGFRNDKGRCLVFVYTGQEGFPTKPEKAFLKLTGAISSGTSVIEIKNLSPGTYAVSVVHDENYDGKINTNIIGMPKEGLGASNNPKSFGPPSFESSEFTAGKESKTIIINLKYL